MTHTIIEQKHTLLLNVSHQNNKIDVNEFIADLKFSRKNLIIFMNMS